MDETIASFLQDFAELLDKYDINAIQPANAQNEITEGYIKFFFKDKVCMDGFSVGDFAYGSYHNILTKVRVYQCELEAPEEAN